MDFSLYLKIFKEYEKKEEKFDRHMARICASIVNGWSKKKVKIEDFLEKKEKKKKNQTFDEMKQVLREIANSFR